MKKKTNLFCFSIFFQKEKQLLENISDFFFDKKKMLDRTLSYSEESLNEKWLNPKSGVLPSFFVGSKEEEEYSVFFSNLPDGWITAVLNLSKRGNCKAIQVRISNRDNPCPVFSYKVIENGITLRVIQLLKEKQWVFYEKGIPLLYEDIELYQSRLKRDRLNKDIILKYLTREGINFSSICEDKRKGYILKTNSFIE